MKILIVEDEARSAQRLERLIRRVAPDARCVHARSLVEGLDRAARDDIDLLFLDLHLDGDDGFTLLAEGVCRAFHTIVVSAHVDRAVEAFEYGVLDFVPKPVMEPRLRTALERFGGTAAGPERARHLVVRRGRSLKRLPVAEVDHIDASRHYSAIHLASGPPEFHDKSLDALGQILPSKFVRTHRSHIVNLERAVAFRSLGGGRYRLRMADGTELPVGRSRVAAVKHLMERDGRLG